MDETFEKDIVYRTIEIIYSTLKNEMEMETYNAGLSVWNTSYGEFNSQGLRQHAPIKLRLNRPTAMLFNMNY